MPATPPGTAFPAAINTTIRSGSDNFAVIHRPESKKRKNTSRYPQKKKSRTKQTAEQQHPAENKTSSSPRLSETQPDRNRKPRNEKQPSPTHRRDRRGSAEDPRLLPLPHRQDPTPKDHGRNH
jgi:hypothetical protein